jgi:hypothetical protein
MATRSIGTSSRDHSTIALWEAACPADITAGGTNENWIGEAYNDSAFNEQVLFSGTTTDSTHVVKLTAAAGQSFRDNANIRTTALDYVGTSAGVTWDTSFAYSVMIDISEANVIIERFQIKVTPTGGGAFGFMNRTAGTVVQNCILKNGIHQPLPAKVINCLLVKDSSGTLITALGSNFEFCTFINTFGSGPLGTGDYVTTNIENCAWFGFTTGWSMGSHGTLTGGHNATDLATAPGTSNQTSLTFSAQVVNTTNDFRAKSGGAMVNGTPATSYATDDISGTSRDATTPTIGAWELVAAAGAAAQNLLTLLGVGL